MKYILITLSYSASERQICYHLISIIEEERGKREGRASSTNTRQAAASQGASQHPSGLA